MRFERGGLFVAPAFLAVVVTAGIPAVAQTDVHVDDDCDGSGTGSVGDPYCTIQQAICFLRNAPGGGTAHVHPGTYNEAIRFFPGVSVVSTDGPSVTTINAAGASCYLSDCTLSSVTPCTAVYFPTGSSTNAQRLEGFHITGGAGLNQTCNGSCNIQSGAGIFILRSSPTITKNEIAGNALQGSPRSFYGAGIYVQSSRDTSPAQPVITDNLIEANVNNSPAGQNQNNPAFSLGGGIYVGFHAAPLVDGNTIRLNASGDFGTSDQIAGGGGIGVYTAWDAGAVTVVSRNLIQTNSTTGRGGGVNVWYGDPSFAPSVARIENNVIEYNDGVDGGGIAARWTIATARNNTVANNLAETGGGISIYDTGSPSDQMTVVNNILALNTANTGGGGLYVSFADPFVSHNDLFGDVPDEVAGDFDELDYIDVDGNFSSDPMFTNTLPGSRNLRLQSASPAIEAGDNAEASTEDLDAVPRVQDGNFDEVATVDLGAFEFSPDFDGDGTPDWEDDDDDDDGAPDVADCRDYSASVSIPAGSVPGLRVKEIGAGTQLTWDRGVQGHTSNLYRGTVGSYFSDSCLLSERPGRSSVDTAIPPLDSGFYYLVSAKNACGESETALGVNAPSPCGPMSADSDLDLLEDVLDNCAMVANADQLDADGDWVGDACDNCLGIHNANQVDLDDDGFGNSCDCVPDNAAYGNSLPDVEGLIVSAGAFTTLTWIDQGPGAVYDVARGAISTLRLDGDIASATCPGDDVAVATWQDLQADPAPDQGFYYVVRTQNNSCTGFFGTDSNAVNRPDPVACL